MHVVAGSRPQVLEVGAYVALLLRSMHLLNVPRSVFSAYLANFPTDICLQLLNSKPKLPCADLSVASTFHTRLSIREYIFKANRLAFAKDFFGENRRTSG